MSTFKVTNRTDTKAKRDPNYNSVLKVDYIDEMERKTLDLKPFETIYFTAKSLPLSLHKLRIKGLVSVTEISATQLSKLQRPSKSKGVVELPKPKKKVAVKKETPKITKKSPGRPTSKKVEDK